MFMGKCLSQRMKPKNVLYILKSMESKVNSPLVYTWVLLKKVLHLTSFINIVIIVVIIK